MGMGNYASYADTVEAEFVKEMCPIEFDDFLVALDENDISREDFAQALESDNLRNISSCTEGQAQNVEKAWVKLYDAFKEATGGLELGMGFHEANDRGDEVDGYFFTVDGVYVLSPAGKKYNDKIIRKSWTVFG